MIAADLIDRAHASSVLEIAERYGARLKRISRSSPEWEGPCPVCGGRDRFSINTRKQIWNCRHCGKGGDSISLAQHLSGRSFREAVEDLAGETRLPTRVQAQAAKGPNVGEGDDLNLRLAAAIWDETLAFGAEAKPTSPYAISISTLFPITAVCVGIRNARGEKAVNEPPASSVDSQTRSPASRAESGDGESTNPPRNRARSGRKRAA
jgi:ribosomal protein L37AE/L43A